MSVASEKKVADALGVEVADRGEGEQSVRLVAGQSKAVDYPRRTGSTEEKEAEGYRGNLVSVPGWRTEGLSRNYLRASWRAGLE